jgi:signal transduction histidine kinase
MNSDLEPIELLPLLCGLADELRHRSSSIEATVLVDRACPTGMANPRILHAALANLVSDVCDSMPECRRVVSMGAREEPLASKPARHVKVTFVHNSAIPSFETIDIVRAFAAQHDGSVDREFWAPRGMTVSLRLPVCE